MTLASRITDLVTAIATAFNARVIAPASGYDVARLNGYTGTQAQWLASMAPRYMTKAQRLALTGADLFEGRIVMETDTGVEYRWTTSGTARWIVWTWVAIPFATYADLRSGATGSTEASIVGGMLTLNITGLGVAGGIALDTSYLQMKAGFRPPLSSSFGGFTNYNGTRAVAAMRVDTDGNVYLSTNGGTSAANFSGGVTYRVAG